MSGQNGADLHGLPADADSFAAFYRRFERPVLGFFMRCVGRPDLAADLAAETFARALEGLDGYDPARGRPDQWLFGIARHVLGASLRGGILAADPEIDGGFGKGAIEIARGIPHAYHQQGQADGQEAVVGGAQTVFHGVSRLAAQWSPMPPKM